MTWLSLIASGFLTGEPTLTIGSTIIVLPIFLAFILMIIRGCYLLTRVKRFRRYQELLCGSEFCLIEHLAAFTGQTPSFVVKDMKKMIRIGMFQEVFLDDQEICLMLDRETYQQYLNLQKKKVQQEQQEQRMPPIDSNNEKPNALIAEGKAYIQKIHEANDAIPGEEISAKLFQLEDITSKVFGVVVQHPEKESAIQNFMNYYLPTTLKLVNAYRNFDERQVSGEEISYAKSEISHILDTINLAFENLLSSLYQDDILDITADIATLEKVLAQDGLTGTEFKIPLQEEPKNH
ncbi:MAG: 5-bromo-4-chloroindolyl phosphate hydrolysis family protein [Oscillospiraceae bacterium]